jgi:hypothetical protein
MVLVLGFTATAFGAVARGMVAVTVKQSVALWAVPRADAVAGAHGATPAAATVIKLAARKRYFLIFSSPQSWASTLLVEPHGGLPGLH